MYFKKIPVKKISQIEEETKSLRWIFRGEKNAGWNLKTSLERVCAAFGRKSPKHGAKIEAILLREFKRRFHHYRPEVPENDLEWLAYMQHFGAPTRLLDWTYSLHVAIYFALEIPDPDGYAVWAINQDWLQEQSLEAIKKSYVYLEASPDKRKSIERFLVSRPAVPEEGDDSWFDKILVDRKTPPRFVFCANPFLLNERLTLQKGLFLALGNAKASFEDNLRALQGSRGNILKFILPKRKRLEFLRHLDSLNINSATLFPGLEGFCHSLGVYHHRVRELLNKKKDPVRIIRKSGSTR